LAPRWTSTLARGAANARAVASLVAAGALALYVASGIARLAPTIGDDVDRLDRDLRPLQRTLQPGDRVALLVGPQELPVYPVMPYALAPATVVRVPLADCLRRAEPATCVQGARYVFLPVPPDEAAALGAALGLSPAYPTPLGAFLSRRSP
jgi:hypothetical protein